MRDRRLRRAISIGLLITILAGFVLAVVLNFHIDYGTPTIHPAGLLYVAMQSGDVDSIRKMLNADPSLANTKVVGCTPLYLAVKFNQPNVAIALLEHGADPNSRGDDSDHIAIVYAAGSKNIALLNAFINHGANLEVRDRYGRSLVAIALGARWYEGEAALRKAMGR